MAEDLVRDTKVLNIARLAKMLVDLFGSDEPFNKLYDLENEEIELYLLELNKSITFILASDKKKFDCRVGKAKNPLSRVIITVNEEKILKVLSNIIRSKNNLFGIIKLSKYILPGKIKIKGSYSAAIKLVRCLMIGKHKAYEEKN